MIIPKFNEVIITDIDEPVFSPEEEETKVDNNCPACLGTGALGMFFSDEVNNCPWCEGSGKASQQIINLFFRLEPMFPKHAKMVRVFGNNKITFKKKA